jgi:hypothetical protein
MILAAEAIEAQSVDERDYSSCALTIKKDMLPKAKEIIAKFRAEMASVLEKHPGDETYQLSVQFFRLTEPTQTKSSPTKMREKNEDCKNNRITGPDTEPHPPKRARRERRWQRRLRA